MNRICKHLAVLICCILISTGLIIAADATAFDNCPGNCSHQAAIGTTHFDTLSEALSAATGNTTVTLLRNATGADAMAVNSAITLDLNGYTLSGQDAAKEGLIRANAGIVVKNGTICATGGNCILISGGNSVIETSATLQAGVDASALVLRSTEQVNLDISGSLSNQGTQPAVSICSSGSGNFHVRIQKSALVSSTKGDALNVSGAGKLEIIGGTFRAGENALVLDIPAGKRLDASITGGNFHVDNGQTLVITTGNGSVAPADFVIGGTYNKVPSPFIPAYCRIDDNGNGTYTVTAEYTITFQSNGGTGSMPALKADRGSTITLPRCAFIAPAGKHFKAWSIGEKEFSPGATYTVNSPLTLTAVWQSHYGGSATCTARAICDGCGTPYGEYAAHSLTYISGSGATCTSAGMNSHHKCRNCGQLFVSGVPIQASSLSMPALGHSMEAVAGMEVTCTEDGLLAHEKCSACGLLQAEGVTVTEADLVIPATGHKLEAVAAVESTCMQEGTLAHQVCSVCQGLFLNNRATEAAALVIPAGSHVLSDWQSDANTHWKTCIECGEVFRQHSHKDSDGNESCDDCGYAIPTAAETQPSAEGGGDTFPALIPVIVAAVIAAGGAVTALVKKKK